MKYEKLYNGGKWSEARMTSFIKSALRAASRRWEPKYSALNDACVGPLLNPKSGRMAKHYHCAACNNSYPAKEVQVDHIDPIVDPVKGFEDWDTFIYALYCEKENLQVLCLECHKSKSNAEKQQAKERRQNAK